MKVKKKQYTKRTAVLVLAACCATALLAGCGIRDGAVAAKASTASAVQNVQQEESSQDGVQQGKTLTLLNDRSSYDGNSLGVYVPATLQNGATVATRVDFVDGIQRVLCAQEGCDHSAAACGAFLENAAGTRLIATESELFWVAESNPYPAMQFTRFVDVSGVNGENRRRVGEGFPETGEAFPLYLYDGTKLYTSVFEQKMSANQSGEIQTTNLYALDLTDGALEIVCNVSDALKGQPDESFPWLVGSLDNAALYQVTKAGPQLVSMKDTPEEMAQHLKEEAAAVQSTLVKIAADGTVQDSGVAWSGQEYSVSSLVNGQVFYALDAATGAFVEQNVVTGEKRTLCDTLPKADFSYMGARVGDIQFVVMTIRGEVPDELTTQSFAVNVSTGEAKEITQRIFTNGAEYPMTVFAHGGDMLMVKVEDRPVQRTDIGTGGDAYVLDTVESVCGMISLADFCSGKQNFVPCTILDAAI